MIGLPRTVAVTPDALGASFRASDGSEKYGLSHLKVRSIAENGYKRFPPERKNVHIIVNGHATQEAYGAVVDAEEKDQVVFHAAVDDLNCNRMMSTLKNLGVDTLLTSREDLHSLAKEHGIETLLGQRDDIFDSSSSDVSRDVSSLDLRSYQEFRPIRIAVTPRTLQVDEAARHASTAHLLENTSLQLLKYTSAAQKTIGGVDQRVYENIQVSHGHRDTEHPSFIDKAIHRRDRASALKALHREAPDILLSTDFETLHQAAQLGIFGAKPTTHNLPSKGMEIERGPKVVFTDFDGVVADRKLEEDVDALGHKEGLHAAFRSRDIASAHGPAADFIAAIARIEDTAVLTARPTHAGHQVHATRDKRSLAINRVICNGDAPKSLHTDRENVLLFLDDSVHNVEDVGKRSAAALVPVPSE